MSVVRCALQRSKGLWNSLSTRAVWILQKNIMGIFSGTPPHRDDSPALSLNLTLVFVPYYPYKVALGGYPYGSWRTYPFAGFLDFIFFLVAQLLWLVFVGGSLKIGETLKSLQLPGGSRFHRHAPWLNNGVLYHPKIPKKVTFFCGRMFQASFFKRKIFAESFRKGRSQCHQMFLVVFHMNVHPKWYVFNLDLLT